MLQLPSTPVLGARTYKGKVCALKPRDLDPVPSRRQGRGEVPRGSQCALEKNSKERNCECQGLGAGVREQ